MEVYEAKSVVRKQFTKEDVDKAPDMIIDTIRGEAVNEAFIVYCKGKGYV